MSLVFKRTIISSLLTLLHLTAALADESHMEKTVQALKSSLTRKAMKVGKATKANPAKSACGQYFKEKNSNFLVGCEGLMVPNPSQSFCTIFRLDASSNPTVYGVVFLTLTQFSASTYGPYFPPEDDGYFCRLLPPRGFFVNQSLVSVKLIQMSLLGMVSDSFNLVFPPIFPTLEVLRIPR